MIEIAPETACMLYVGGLIFLLLIIWLRHSHKSKRREIMKMTTVRATCEYCSSSYLIESLTSFHRCPYCQCINQTRENKI